MSEKVLTATRGEADKATQNQSNEIAQQEQRDAFAREFADADVSTDTIIADEKQKQTEEQQRAKLAELNTHLEDADDRRRGLKAIYASSAELIDTMTDEQVEEFIADQLVTSEPTSAEQETAHETRENLPQGFPTIEQIEADKEAVGPVKLSILKRARRLLGAPGRAVWKGYSSLLSRNDKYREKIESMTDEERKKYEKRSNILVYVTTFAIAGAMTASKLGLLEHMPGSSHHSGGTAPVPEKPEHHGGAAPDPNQPTPEQIAEHQAHVNQFVYDPLKDPFNAPGRHEYNFGAGLDTSDPEKAKAQLLENWKHNPQQFAVTMAHFNMIPNNPDSIEHTADLMRTDPSVYADNYDKLTSQITGARFAPPSEGYGSYYAVDNGNGTQSVAYQNAVWGDSQQHIILTSAMGDRAYGCDCDQPIVEAPQTNYAPATSVTETAPQGNGTYTPVNETPHGGGNYTPPEKPPVHQPPQPPVEQPPQPPTEQPPQPEKPPETEYHKGNAYPGHQQLTTDLGPGKFMETPAPVTTHQDTNTGRDIGGGQAEPTVHDTVTNTPSTQTGGQDHGEGATTTRQDISPNAGAGGGVERESGAGTGTTQTGSVGSR